MWCVWQRDTHWRRSIAAPGWAVFSSAKKAMPCDTISTTTICRSLQRCSGTRCNSAIFPTTISVRISHCPPPCPEPQLLARAKGRAGVSEAQRRQVWVWLCVLPQPAWAGTTITANPPARGCSPLQTSTATEKRTRCSRRGVQSITEDAPARTTLWHFPAQKHR